jgi:hypothetical protein
VEIAFLVSVADRNRRFDYIFLLICAVIIVNGVESVMKMQENTVSLLFRIMTNMQYL